MNLSDEEKVNLAEEVEATVRTQSKRIERKLEATNILELWFGKKIKDVDSYNFSDLAIN